MAASRPTAPNSAAKASAGENARLLAALEETAAERDRLKAELADSREALAGLVTPMRETLARYGEELQRLETKREQAYGSLSEQLQ